MGDTGLTQGPFRIIARVPDDMVSLPTDGDWAAWMGAVTPAAGAGVRRAVILVSITVTSLNPAPGVAAHEVLASLLRARHPDGTALIEEYTTPDGHPAVGLRRAVTQEIRARDVTTGQAQALIVFPEAGALGVVSGVCVDPDDLVTAATLVADIAAGLTVTSAAAAA